MELQTLHQHYRRLVEMAKADQDVAASHSIEEAEMRHERKVGSRERAHRSGE